MNLCYSAGYNSWALNKEFKGKKLLKLFACYCHINLWHSAGQASWALNKEFEGKQPLKLLALNQGLWFRLSLLLQNRLTLKNFRCLNKWVKKTQDMQFNNPIDKLPIERKGNTSVDIDELFQLMITLKLTCSLLVDQLYPWSHMITLTRPVMVYPSTKIRPWSMVWVSSLFREVKQLVKNIPLID